MVARRDSAKALAADAMPMLPIPSAPKAISSSICPVPMGRITGRQGTVGAADLTAVQDTVAALLDLPA